MTEYFITTKTVSLLSVWERNQSRLLAECKTHGGSLSNGSDRKADQLTLDIL